MNRHCPSGFHRGGLVIAIARTTRIFVYTAATDMRNGSCGLSGLVKKKFDIDLFSGHLFVFFNRRRDYVRILARDTDGLPIWSKRPERKKFEKLTRTPDGNSEIDSDELVMMLRGVETEG